MRAEHQKRNIKPLLVSKEQLGPAMDADVLSSILV